MLVIEKTNILLVSDAVHYGQQCENTEQCIPNSECRKDKDGSKFAVSFKHLVIANVSKGIALYV